MNIEKGWSQQSKKDKRTEIQEGIEEYMRPDKEEGARKKEAKIVGYVSLGDNDYETHEEQFTLTDCDDFLENYGYDAVEDIYRNYEKAMERKSESHGRYPLEEERFIYHFFEGGSYDESMMYGSKEKGYLLGGIKYGVFMPSHFAPKTLRGGYDLLKQFGQSQEVPAVLAITEDLVETITKMDSWQKIDLEFMQTIDSPHGAKYIVHNSHPKIQKLLWGLACEYYNEHYQNEYDEEE